MDSPDSAAASDAQLIREKIAQTVTDAAELKAQVEHLKRVFAS
jgi:hypothetical protein